jgi:hypothetical protein
LRALPTNIIEDAGVDVAASFAQIRSRILSHYDETQDQKLRKLLSEQVLGDQKPSQALRKLQNLAGGKNENLVRLRFQDMLPVQIKVVLATLDGVTLDKLAEAADKMWEQLPQSSSTNTIASSSAQNVAVSHSFPSNPIAQELTESRKEVAELRSQVSELTQAVRAISTRQDNSFRGRNRSQSRGRFGGRGRGRGRSPSPRRPYNPDGRLCYYHYNFGRNANRCNKSNCGWNRTPDRSQGNAYTPAAGRP